jgi:general transcription factor 3C polypeptide 5 (transcription factor C subunit 1)
VDPTSAPLLSNNTPSSNVLLKITVPKRTGRKRKRGSDGPYMLDPCSPAQNVDNETAEKNQPTELRSHSRLDNPKDLLRALKDNVGRYEIEPVGSIDQTHRYRGM